MILIFKINWWWWCQDEVDCDNDIDDADDSDDDLSVISDLPWAVIFMFGKNCNVCKVTVNEMMMIMIMMMIWMKMWWYDDDDGDDDSDYDDNNDTRWWLPLIIASLR